MLLRQNNYKYLVLDADATGTQDGIFLDGTNNSIKIFASGCFE